MNRYVAAVVVAALFGPGVAFAKCADEIKALQGKAAGSDSVSKPGNQEKTSSPGTMPNEGGGAESASAKILEAQAHDQKGDEPACMRAIGEAKAIMAR